MRSSLPNRAIAVAVTGLLLGGCLAPMPQPIVPLNSRLEAIGANRDPALSGRWLALISGRGGREQVMLLDLERQQPLDLPGLNRADAQPVSVSVDAAGERIALVRQLEGRTELVLYRRSVQSLQPIPMVPSGVARQVQLQADGRQLAIQVSRGGIWQVDLVQIP
jgi:Tol biopolymer transport system component